MDVINYDHFYIGGSWTPPAVATPYRKRLASRAAHRHRPAVEQDETGWWCAHASLPGGGA